MISSFGNILIILNILISILIIFKSNNNLNLAGINISQKIYTYCSIQLILSLFCFFTLIYGFLISDFSLLAVFQNSHNSKPLFYKFSGTWGNHEGSLLLWTLILVIFSFLFLKKNIQCEKKYRLITLIIQNILILSFYIFLLLNSNPFSIIQPVPLEGLGLNPILQDPALAIHPPILYVGLVSSSIFFSAALSSLITNFHGKNFAKSISNWVIVSWSFQTLGIIVGSIWAYYELGWGGFWFWDPVENASLLPWFAMTALMHSVLVLKNRDSLYSWVILLCLITFILSVLGTFLVRSGVLNSVHTFANDPSRGLFILLILAIMTISSIIIYFKNTTNSSLLINFKSKENFIIINNWIMIFYLVTVLIGTIYPIITEVIFETKISVGPPYYDFIIIPTVIFLLILMSVGPKLSWIKSKLPGYTKIISIFILSVIINYFLYLYIGKISLITNFIFISALFLFLSTIKDFYDQIKKRSFYDGLPRIISHLGFSALVLFIGINAVTSVEKDFNIKVGDTKEFENYEIKFKNLNIYERKNYKAIVGSFEVQNLNKKYSENLNPEIRVYDKPETLTYEASINTNLVRDYYLTMSNINNSEIYNIKFQDKPFMIWIWISSLVICLGGILRMIMNYEK